MLKRNLIANYLGQGWSALMSIVFVPVYIKYIGIEAYGLIGLFAVLQSWLNLLDLGMSPTLNREMARFTAGSHTATSIRDLLRSIEVVVIIIAMLLTLILWGASDWIAKEWLRAEKLPIETIAQTFTIMGFVTALRFVESIYRSALLGLQRQALYNLVNSILATLRGLGAVGVLMWWSPTIVAFFIWQGLVSILSVLILCAITYGSLPQTDRSARFSFSALREISGFAGGMTAIAFLSFLLMQVDKILLSNLLSLAEYGYYTLAVAVAGSLYMLTAPIGQAFQPKLCELYSSASLKEMAEIFHKGAQLVTAIVGSYAIVIITYAYPILFLWTQDQQISQQTYRILQFITLGNFLNSLCWMPYLTQIAYGWTSLSIKVNIVAVSVIVPAILWTAPRYGAEGTALLWVALNAGYILISIHLSFRKILTSADKWIWYVKDVILPLLPATTIVMISKIFFPIQSNRIFQLVYIIIISSIALAITVFFASKLRVVVCNILNVRFKRRLYI